MSPKEKKEFIKEVANVIEMVKEYKSGNLKEISNDSLEKSLASLKQTALRAQKKWEKMNEGKLNEDDPKKDYGGYSIRNPDSRYALRNLPPTNDPKELKRRDIQMQIEKFLTKAPRNWYDAYLFKRMPIGTVITDPDTRREYVISASQELLPKEKVSGSTSKEKKETIPDNKLVADYSESAFWLAALLVLLRALMITL